MPTATPISRVNDFVVRFANVNGSGSASANEMFGRAILRMGIPVAPRNIFPSNIQGLPTWYEVRVSEAGRCLNCDVQTVFSAQLCIECDACVDICPMDCITFTPNGEEADLRTRLSAPAPNPTQDLYVANGLKTGRVMVKDEDVCLHCGLCAERCPTGAWDMKKFYLETAKAQSCSR